MKKYFFLFFFSCSISFFSQNTIQEKKDSLINYLNKINNKKLSQEVKEDYAKKATLLLHPLSDSLKFKTNIQIALMYFRKRKLDSLKKYSFFAKNNAEKLNDLSKIEKSHFYLATYYKYKEIPDSAYYHYNSSINILLKQGDTITAGRRLLNIAVVQSGEDDLLGSEITTITSLKYLEKSNLHRIKADLYNNLGILSQDRVEYEEALKYYNISLNYLNKSKINEDVIKSILNYYINVAIIYKLKKEYKKANSIVTQGLKKFDSIEEKYPLKYALLLYNQTANNYHLNNEKNLLNNCNKILKISKKGNYITLNNLINVFLAFYYKDKGNIGKATFFTRKALKGSINAKENERTLKMLKLLSELTKGKESKNYLKEYIKLNDSLNVRERLMKNQFAKIRYETEKKELENANLKTENLKKQLELESEEQQKLIGWLIAGTSILLLAFGYTITFNRRKKLLFESKLQQVAAREKERQQIAKSLHDEVAGDIRMLHLKLAKTNLLAEANSLQSIKENVRNLSHQLSSESFDKVSFKDQIINLISDYFDSDFRIKVNEINNIDWKGVNNSIKRTLFLSIRETIQNAKKHAEASEVILNFKETKKTITLVISDNGKGFNTNAKKKGIGLKNLKERIEEINGIFTLESEIKRGTKTTIEIPKNGR